jgi:hypothetical protein
LQTDAIVERLVIRLEIGRRGLGGADLDVDRLDLPVRSMGMSDDFEAACRLGSTEIRLGRALFGPRNP